MSYPVTLELPTRELRGQSLQAPLELLVAGGTFASPEAPRLVGLGLDPQEEYSVSPSDVISPLPCEMSCHRTSIATIVV